MPTTDPYQNDLRFLELLQRWRDGRFTRSDEAELQELARTDPFRQEAWEGFQELPELDHQAALDRLQEKLFPRPKRRGLIAWWPQLMAAAAGLVLLIGVLVFFPRHQEQQSVSAVEKPGTAVESAPALPPPSASEPLAVNDKAKKQGESAPSTTVYAPPQSPGLASTVKAKADSLEYRRAADLNGTAVVNQAEDRLAVHTDAGRKNETLGGPAQNANFEKVPAPLSPNGPVSAQAAKESAKRSEPLPPARQNTIPDEKEPMPLSEVVITRAPVSKQKAAKADVAAKAAPMKKKAMKDTDVKPVAASDDTNTANGQPQMGWAAFKTYVVQNIQLPEDVLNHKASGIVRLSFAINKKGHPKRIQKLQTLGHGCEEEAIRLVNSVLWTGDKATADIEFRVK